MPELTNDNVTIHYEDEGSGKPVLLLHGHTLDRRLWDPVMPALLEAGLRVVRMDLRGHGLSSRPDFGYHTSHHASDVAAVCHAVDAGPVALVGHSIGGAVAMEVAVTSPEHLQSLVLLAPVMPERPFEPAFMTNLRAVAGVIRSEGMTAAMDGPWAENPLFEHSFTKPGVREATSAMTRDFPGAEYLATQRDRVERDWNLPDRLSELDLPAVVVVGEKETPGFRAYAGEAAEKIAGARLEVVEDCGHMLPLEEPEAVARAIIEAATF